MNTQNIRVGGLLEGTFCSKPPKIPLPSAQFQHPLACCQGPWTRSWRFKCSLAIRGGGDLVFSIIMIISSLLFKIWQMEQCAIHRPMRKGRDPEFDFKRMAFVQEATGRQTEDLVVAAQSNVQNARRTSLQAAYNLFTTSLQNDHVLHDKHLAASEVNSQRTRSVLVASLEDSRYMLVYYPKYNPSVIRCFQI